jgi:Tfp pilus assembly protein PilE
MFALITMSFETGVNVMLTSLGVMLAGLGVVIAVAAIWGYHGLVERAESAAAKAAEGAIQAKLSEYFENEAIKDKLRHEVMLHMSAAGDEVYADLAAVTEISSNCAQVGDIYPGEEGSSGIHHDEQDAVHATACDSQLSN